MKKKLLFCLFSLGILCSILLILSFGCCGSSVSRSGVVINRVSPSVATPENTFSLLCYNIQSRPVLDASNDKAPLIGIAASSADIVALQESFVGTELLFRSWGPDCSERKEMAYFNRRRHPLKLCNSGLAILAAHTILATEAEYFQSEGSLENRLASKGVLMARINLPNGIPLDVYTTHLAAGSERFSGEARRKQSEQIIAFIKRNSPPENCVIVCGDLNLRHDGVAGKILDRISTEAGLTNAGPADQTPKRIDHVFYRGSSNVSMTPVRWEFLSFRDVTGKPLSDHAPLRVKFRLDRISL